MLAIYLLCQGSKVHTQNSKLNARGASRERKYIRGVSMNGKAGRALWFRHADLRNGLEIDLEMSDTPDKSIGTAPADLPPSSMALDPAELQ